MNRIFKTIAKDIIVLSAQAVAFRLAASEDQQQDIVFAAVPYEGNAAGKGDHFRECPQGAAFLLRHPVTRKRLQISATGYITGVRGQRVRLPHTGEKSRQGRWEGSSPPACWFSPRVGKATPSHTFPLVR